MDVTLEPHRPSTPLAVDVEDEEPPSLQELLRLWLGREDAQLTSFQRQLMERTVEACTDHERHHVLLGIGGTGCGKTACLFLPFVHHLLSTPWHSSTVVPLHLVVVPTRVLQNQHMNVARAFSERMRDHLRIGVFTSMPRLGQRDTRNLDLTVWIAMPEDIRVHGKVTPFSRAIQQRPAALPSRSPSGVSTTSVDSNTSNASNASARSLQSSMQSAGFALLGVAVDEVHLDSWESFRPAFRTFYDSLRASSTLPPTMFVTATYTTVCEELVTEVRRASGAHQHVVREPIYHASTLSVRAPENMNMFNVPELFAEIVQEINGNPESQVLVFWNSRVSVTTMYNHFMRYVAEHAPALAERNFLGFPVRVTTFTGALDANSKDALSRPVTDGTFRVVFATTALGQGVDTLRATRVYIVYTTNLELADIRQMSGRTGRSRDGPAGHVILYLPTKQVWNDVCGRARVREEWRLLRQHVSKGYCHVRPVQFVPDSREDAHLSPNKPVHKIPTATARAILPLQLLFGDRCRALLMASLSMHHLDPEVEVELARLSRTCSPADFQRGFWCHQCDACGDLREEDDRTSISLRPSVSFMVRVVMLYERVVATFGANPLLHLPPSPPLLLLCYALAGKLGSAGIREPQSLPLKNMLLEIGRRLGIRIEEDGRRRREDEEQPQETHFSTDDPKDRSAQILACCIILAHAYMTREETDDIQDLYADLLQLRMWEDRRYWMVVASLSITNECLSLYSAATDDIHILYLSSSPLMRGSSRQEDSGALRVSQHSWRVLRKTLECATCKNMCNGGPSAIVQNMRISREREKEIALEFYTIAGEVSSTVFHDLSRICREELNIHDAVEIRGLCGCFGGPISVWAYPDMVRARGVEDLIRFAHSDECEQVSDWSNRRFHQIYAIQKVTGTTKTLTDYVRDLIWVRFLPLLRQENPIPPAPSAPVPSAPVPSTPIPSAPVPSATAPSASVPTATATAQQQSRVGPTRQSARLRDPAYRVGQHWYVENPNEERRSLSFYTCALSGDDVCVDSDRATTDEQLHVQVSDEVVSREYVVHDVPIRIVKEGEEEDAEYLVRWKHYGPLAYSKEPLANVDCGLPGWDRHCLNVVME